MLKSEYWLLQLISLEFADCLEIPKPEGHTTHVPPNRDTTPNSGINCNLMMYKRSQRLKCPDLRRHKSYRNNAT